METTQQIFEELLVLNAQNGDAKAITLLVNRWNFRIRSQIYHHTNDAEVAVDLAQEVWIAIFNGINKLQDARKFGAWALSIASKKAIDWIRKAQVERKRDSVREMVAHEMTEESASDNEMVNSLRKGLKSLPDDQRMILSLYYMESMSIPDISGILDVPAGTVKSRLFYARENLKKIIVKHERVGK